MTKRTSYAVLNKKGEYMGETDTREEAMAIVEKAQQRGWTRTIKEVTREYLDSTDPWWMFEGYAYDPTKCTGHEENPMLMEHAIIRY